VLSDTLQDGNFQWFTVASSKITSNNRHRKKIDSFPKDFAMVSGARFVQGVANMNDTTLEDLVYRSS
jgi:hypothetical protein